MDSILYHTILNDNISDIFRYKNSRVAQCPSKRYCTVSFTNNNILHRCKYSSVNKCYLIDVVLYRMCHLIIISILELLCLVTEVQVRCKAKHRFKVQGYGVNALLYFCSLNQFVKVIQLLSTSVQQLTNLRFKFSKIVLMNPCSGLW